MEIHESRHLTKVKEAIINAIFNDLPHGSGINCEWHFKMSTPTRVQATNAYHCMNEGGYYDGYADFTLLFDFKDRDYFRLMFHGSESQNNAAKYSLREYLEDILWNALNTIFTDESKLKWYLESHRVDILKREFVNGRNE